MHMSPSHANPDLPITPMVAPTPTPQPLVSTTRNPYLDLSRAKKPIHGNIKTDVDTILSKCNNTSAPYEKSNSLALWILSLPNQVSLVF